MSDANGQHEPTTEEILASIRRIIAAESEAPAPAAPPPRIARPDDILDLTEVVREDGSVVSIAAKPVGRAAAPPEPQADAAAMGDAVLAQLARADAPEPAAQETRLGDAGRTLEDVVRDLLRPLVRDWVERNLPPLVERVVRDEVARLAGDATRR